MTKQDFLAGTVAFLMMAAIGYVLGITAFIERLNALYEEELQPKLAAALEQRDSAAFKYWADQVAAFIAQRKNLMFLLNPLNWIKHSGWKPIPYFPKDQQK